MYLNRKIDGVDGLGSFWEAFGAGLSGAGGEAAAEGAGSAAGQFAGEFAANLGEAGLQIGTQYLQRELFGDRAPGEAPSFFPTSVQSGEATDSQLAMLLAAMQQRRNAQIPKQNMTPYILGGVGLLAAVMILQNKK